LTERHSLDSFQSAQAIPRDLNQLAARLVQKATESADEEADPDPAHISTSYVERQNLSKRMVMRRFTRLTEAFSKKVENLAHAVSPHFMYYSFYLVHSSLTIKNEDGTTTKRTPAMAARNADYPWSLTQLAGLLD
jgi:hypothetical protein